MLLSNADFECRLIIGGNVPSRITPNFRHHQTYLNWIAGLYSERVARFIPALVCICGMFVVKPKFGDQRFTVDCKKNNPRSKTCPNMPVGDVASCGPVPPPIPGNMYVAQFVVVICFCMIGLLVAMRERFGLPPVPGSFVRKLGFISGLSGSGRPRHPCLCVVPGPIGHFGWRNERIHIYHLNRIGCSVDTVCMHGMFLPQLDLDYPCALLPCCDDGNVMGMHEHEIDKIVGKFTYIYIYIYIYCLRGRGSGARGIAPAIARIVSLNVGVDGRLGACKFSRSNVRRICLAIGRLLQLNRIIGQQMGHLVGHACCMMMTRCMFSLVDSCYKFTRCFHRRPRVLWPEARNGIR